MGWRSEYKKSMEIGRLRKEIADLKKSFWLSINKANENKQQSEQERIQSIYRQLLMARIAAQQQAPLPSLLSCTGGLFSSLGL